MKILMLVMVMLIPNLIYSTTLEVSQDGLHPYNHIQDAINASNNGDVVLVHPGRYLENINFSGKNITIASLNFTTGNPIYIGTTIIDGQRLGSCVNVITGESSAHIIGFSITNGSGTFTYQYKAGGGIRIENYSNLSIDNCRIFQNETEFGGGLYGWRATVHLSGTSFFDNLATSGGGAICLEGNQINFSMDATNRCSVYNNYSGQGTDFLCMDVPQTIPVVVDTFTVQVPNRYYAETQVNFIPDTYGYNFDIQHAFINPVNHDLYVSTNGNDQNDGLSPESSFRTIAWALHNIASDSLSPKTVHIADGIYSKSINQQKLPLSGKSFINLVGESKENTIIDGDAYYEMLSISTGVTDFLLKKMTLTNLITTDSKPAIFGVHSKNVYFEDLIISDCISEKSPAMVLLYTQAYDFKNISIVNNESIDGVSGVTLSDISDVEFENCKFIDNQSNFFEMNQAGSLRIENADSVLIRSSIFRNNTDYAQFGGAALVLRGPQFDPGHFRIENCLFDNNRSTYNSTGDKGSPIVVSGYSTFDFVNCTFADNYSSRATLLQCADNVNLYNCVFADSSMYEVFLSHPLEPNVPDNHITVDHCNMKGGMNSILNQDGWGTITWQDGNIDETPLFNYTNVDKPYELMAGSPCIDAGTTDVPGGLYPFDLNGAPRIYGNSVDMGCYEFGSVGNEDYLPPEVSATKLFNYPNPFNPSTTICFNINKASQVNLYVYNVRGQLVRQLTDENILIGQHKVIWDGKNGKGKDCGSGIYLYKLKTGDNSITRKMLLLK